MGRLVQPTRTIEVPAGGGLETPGRSTRTEVVSGDQFTERLVKYIPAEVIGAYLSLENLLDLKGVVSKTKLAATEAVTQLSGPGSESVSPLAGPVAPGDLMALYGPKFPMAAFLLGVICTPIYIWQQGRAQKAPWATHAVVATLAFVVWAYAMGSSFFLQNFGSLTALYNPQVAAAGLVAFTLVSGAVKPGEQVS